MSDPVMRDRLRFFAGCVPELTSTESNKSYIGVRGGSFRTDIHDLGIPNEIQRAFGRSNLNGTG